MKPFPFLARVPGGRSLRGLATWFRGGRGLLAKGILGGCALGLLLIPGCRRHPKAPDWTLSAPAQTVMAFSCQAGWVLEQPRLQSLLEAYPMVDQTLDLFLKKAKINPHQETGRVTLYLLSDAALLKEAGAKPQPGDFLLQLGGFRDAGALQVAMADAFPAEGTLGLEGRECPLYVLLDVSAYHLRALVDPEGRIWLGDLAGLTRLASAHLPARSPVLQSVQWTRPGAPFQGFLRPEGILRAASLKVQGEWARNLPVGVESMAWSVTPGTGNNPLHEFDLAIYGSPESILQVAPWLQRLAAAATGLQPGGAQAPELLQEKRRIGLRARLTQEQLNLALAKLSQPALNLRPDPGNKRP